MHTLYPCASLITLSVPIMAVRVALVEDNDSFRRRFVERFRFFEEVSLVLSASNGQMFLRRVAALPEEDRPEVVLMDIEMPGMSGIETTLRLKEARPEIDVIMLTVFKHDEKVFDSIRAGAAGYLLKDASADEVVGAILELARGGAPMSPEVARRMLQFVRSGENVHRPEASDEDAIARFELTDRELDILHHLVEDKTEAVLADELHISPHTVRTHIKNIYKKLHVHSRASAVRVALEERLLGR